MSYCKSLKEFKLFDNQINNVKALIQRRRALLSDRCGAGKTLSILTAFAYLYDNKKLENLLVFMPNSAYQKQVWQKDINKFTYLKCIDLETLVARYQGRFQNSDFGNILKEYPIIICKHSHVRNYIPYLMIIANLPMTMVCCDESHAFKNPKSDMTNKFRLVINHAQNRWFITGTTLSKNLEDTYNIINLLSPWFLGTFNNFRDTYCVCQEKIIGKKNGRLVVAKNIVGISNQEAFQARLAPLVITGESFFDLKFHWMDYNLSESESNVYRKVAKGLDVQSEATAEQWMEYIMNNDVDVHPIKDVERYSSRFIYLQSCADGLLSERGCIENNDNSTKVDLLEKTIDTIISKGQSCIVYFDYLATVHIVESRLKDRYGNKAQVLLSTGENVLDGNAVTEQKCKNLPHIILGTKASSESVSYYFINNVIFFHIPTVPSVFIQTTGRITRKNSLYPDDLNVFIFRSNNIDLYKMYVVSSKTAQMEILQGHEGNVPDDYKQQSTDIGFIDTAKKVLLWVK